MRSLIWKLRIAMLWVFYAVGMALMFVLSLLAPGFIDDLRAGRVEGMPTDGPLSLVMLVYVMVPLALAVLTFVMNNTAVRWVNVVVGAVMGLSMIPDIIGHMGVVLGLPIAATLTVLAGLLIAIIAWMAPKQVTTTTAHPEDALAS